MASSPKLQEQTGDPTHFQKLLCCEQKKQTGSFLNHGAMKHANAELAPAYENNLDRTYYDSTYFYNIKDVVFASPKLEMAIRNQILGVQMGGPNVLPVLIKGVQMFCPMPCEQKLVFTGVPTGRSPTVSRRRSTDPGNPYWAPRGQHCHGKSMGNPWESPLLAEVWIGFKVKASSTEVLQISKVPAFRDI